MLRTAALACRHVLAAIHAAVVVAVRAATILHVVTLMLALLAAPLSLTVLAMLGVLGMPSLALHVMALVLIGGWRCLRGGR
jgi:hypothetical protein